MIDRETGPAGPWRTAGLPPEAQPPRPAFSGLWIPLVSPMRPDGALDLPALARLVRHLTAEGADGFVVCGSTGEAAMLSPEEQSAALGTVLQALQEAKGPQPGTDTAVPPVPPVLPVLMGLQGLDAEAIARRGCELLSEHPRLAGYLLAAPPYVRPSQAALIRHYHRVADGLERPLVAYDIPARTGVKLEIATLRALAEHPRIRALKDCSGDRAIAEAVLADGRLALLAGNDDECFDQIARGAAGAITASAHLATHAFAHWLRRMHAGQLPAARRLWQALRPVIGAAFAEPNPAPLKAALASLGFGSDRLRAPMLPADPDTARRLLQAAASAEAAIGPRSAAGRAGARLGPEG